MPDRPARDLPCPLLDACGACEAMRLLEADQLSARVAAVRRATGRAPDRVVPSPRPLGYRARVSLRVGPDGRLGYHRPRSHELVLVPRCAIARPEIDTVMQALPPFPAGVTEVELRTDGARTVLVARRERRSDPDLERRVLDLGLHEITGLSAAQLGGRALFGEPWISLSAGGVEHRVGPGVFYQVNLEVNALLVEAVLEAVGGCAPSAVLDLYSGYGNLGLPLAARGIPVTLWESEEAALATARRTCLRLGLNAAAKAGDAARFRAGDAFFEVAIVDPPREGAPGLLAQLVVTRPKRVAYVSCHPPSLARDLRPALEAGYRLSHLAVFDMFPQTFHVETLAVLTRNDLAT